MGNYQSTTNNQLEDGLVQAQTMNGMPGERGHIIRKTNQAMTSSAVSDAADLIDSTLSCSICLDLFEGNPRMLLCGHTNCTRCLEELWRVSNGIIKCPLCQMPFTLLVKQLPVNFVAKQLVDIWKRKNASNDINSNQMATSNGVKDDGSKDVWTLEEEVRYRWKDWGLICSWNSMFIWCDAIVLELRFDSRGWIDFFVNNRLGTLFNNGRTQDYDDADKRAEFLHKFHNAKKTIPSGARTESILSFPRISKTIHFGNWDLSSVEAGTMLVTHREFTQPKLTIKEDSHHLVLRLLRDQH